MLTRCLSTRSFVSPLSYINSVLTLSAFPKETPPYAALILVEPTSISVERYIRETTTHEPKSKQRTQGTLSRRDQWASRSEAYAWLEKRLPWKLWDSQVLQTYVVCRIIILAQLF